MADTEKEVKKAIKKKVKAEKSAPTPDGADGEEENKKFWTGPKIAYTAIMGVAVLGSTAGIVLAFTQGSGVSPNAVVRIGEKTKAGSWDSSEQTSEFDYLVGKVNTFSSKLFQEVNKASNPGENNVVYSPVTLYSGLASVCEVASESIQDELSAILGATSDDINDFFPLLFRACNQKFTNEDSGKTTGREKMCNSFWLDNRFTYDEDVIETLNDDFFIDCYTGNFDLGTARINKAMNDYAASGLENTMTPDYNFDDSTIATINTMYMKEAWTDLGENLRDAEKHDFQLPDKSMKKVTYYECPRTNAQVRDNGDYTSMYIKTGNNFRIDFILPKPDVDVNSLFTPEVLDEYETYTYKTQEIEDEIPYKLYTIVEIPEFDASFSGNIEDQFFSTFTSLEAINSFDEFATLNEDAPGVSAVEDDDDEGLALEFNQIVQSNKVEFRKNGINPTSTSGSNSFTQPEKGNLERDPVIFRLTNSFIFSIKDPQGIKLYQGIIYKV